MASGGDVEEVVLAMSKASIEVEVKEGDGKKVDRHCGFCLTLVPGEEVKLCSKCKRRAYCSKECQVADWKATPDAPATNGRIYGYAQGHKNWCGLPYGEEDLDWKVVPITGKGLGIVGLRDIPHLYRIMVEGMQQLPQNPDGEKSVSVSQIHPAMRDLHPANSDISTKFEQNHVPSSLRGLKLGLRLSRINHSCRPNAAYDVDHPTLNFAVFVVGAERDIKAGEEICRSYQQGQNFPFQCGIKAFDFEVCLIYKTPEECREEYSNKWGFVCHESCPCRDEKVAKLLEELKELVEYCVANPLKKPALKKIQKVIENAREFGIGLQNTATLYLLAFQLAVTRRQTLGQAKKYLQMVLDSQVAILHPKAFSNVVPKWTPSDFSKHPKYLAAER